MPEGEFPAFVDEPKISIKKTMTKISRVAFSRYSFCSILIRLKSLFGGESEFSKKKL